VSKQRLLFRNGVYYYRRRVPTHLVEQVGKRFIQLSLHTSSLKEAKRLRTIRDLEWEARFQVGEASLNAEEDVSLADEPAAASRQLTQAELLELVRDYVARHDQRAEQRFATCYPESPAERQEMRIETEFEAQILKQRHNQQAQEWISLASQHVLQPAGKSFKDLDVPAEALAELVRRGLLELTRRHHARLTDDHSRNHFDQLFDPAGPATVTFGKLADQWLQLTEEEALINGLGQKGLDRQRATLALIREIIGDQKPVGTIDYDTCLSVRGVLAHLPAHRTKLYGDLPIEQAIQAAAREGKPGLSPVTQQQYLAILRDVLDLAAKKRLIAINFADGLKPIKRDTLSPSEKRHPFELQQIADFFKSSHYAESAKHSPPFSYDKAGWRFWLPLMCVFMGMRPKEAAQMRVDDLKHTDKGTWYLHIIATADDEGDSEPSASGKTLKTTNSRRKIPVHPELIKIGFLQFVAQRKKSEKGPRLFPDLKADKYGDVAWYAMKRFNESYLPKAIKMQDRQSFYSFRHSFRDALRRADAPAHALQALGGWSQGSLTSSNYGDKTDPDYTLKFVKKISFPGLDLSGLWISPDSLSAKPSTD
jgi:integrase